MSATKTKPQRWYRNKGRASRWLTPPPYYRFLAEREAAIAAAASTEPTK